MPMAFTEYEVLGFLLLQPLVKRLFGNANGGSNADGSEMTFPHKRVGCRPANAKNGGDLLNGVCPRFGQWAFFLLFHSDLQCVVNITNRCYNASKHRKSLRLRASSVTPYSEEKGRGTWYAVFPWLRKWI